MFLILTEDRSGLAGSGSGDSFYQEVWMKEGGGVNHLLIMERGCVWCGCGGRQYFSRHNKNKHDLHSFIKII